MPASVRYQPFESIHASWAAGGGSLPLPICRMEDKSAAPIGRRSCAKRRRGSAIGVRRRPHGGEPSNALHTFREYEGPWR